MSEDEIPHIRTPAEAKAYGRKTREDMDREIADVLARKPKREDLAETYITRVEELAVLNAECTAELTLAREELASLRELLDACTQANLEFQRQNADLQQQVEAEVRLRQQDFDRGTES